MRISDWSSDVCSSYLMAARMCLAEIPLKHFLEELLIPYETDEVTRLIIDTHDAAALAEMAHLNVGDFRNWLLSDAADSATLKRGAPGIPPEMASSERRRVGKECVRTCEYRWWP